jgi:hypothetical protein
MTSTPSSADINRSGTAVAALVPITDAVFPGFLSVSIPLTALSLEMRGHFGFGRPSSDG